MSTSIHREAATFRLQDLHTQRGSLSTVPRLPQPTKP